MHILKTHTHRTLKPPDQHPSCSQAIIDENIQVVETAGSPLCAKYWDMLKQANKDIVIIHKCVSVRHALKAQQGGCDFISLDGFECAGHPGACCDWHPSWALFDFS